MLRLPDQPTYIGETYFADSESETWKLRLMIAWIGDVWEARVYDLPKHKCVYAQMFALGSQAQHEAMLAANVYLHGRSLGEVEWYRSGNQ